MLFCCCSVQQTMESIRKNSFDSPEYDPAYVRARELAAAEKEAEEKAKAALLHFSKQDHSHEMVMKNGFMVPKSTDSSPARPQAGKFRARVCVDQTVKMTQTFRYLQRKATPFQIASTERKSQAQQRWLPSLSSNSTSVRLQLCIDCQLDAVLTVKLQLNRKPRKCSERPLLNLLVNRPSTLAESYRLMILRLVVVRTYIHLM